MNIKNIALSNQNKILLQELDKKENIKDYLPKEDNIDYTLELNSLRNRGDFLSLQLIQSNQNNSFKTFNSQMDVLSKILGFKNYDKESGLTVYEKVQQKLTNISESAKEQISENGYWGVEKTAERIFSFARQSANNDIKKIDFLKSAINLGFEEAKRVWGGELPEITDKTHERIMEKFDLWEEEINKNSEKIDEANS